jgi:pyruvate carboxylase subunit B
VIFEAQVDARTVRVEVRQRDGRYTVALDGDAMEVDFAEAGPHFASLLIAGQSYEVGIERAALGYQVALPGASLLVRLEAARRGGGAPPQPRAGGPARLLAPMPGKIVRVLAAVGEQVTAGQGLVVMEAMKMENELRAARAGRVGAIHVGEGQAVETGALLVSLD